MPETVLMGSQSRWPTGRPWHAGDRRRAHDDARAYSVTTRGWTWQTMSERAVAGRADLVAPAARRQGGGAAVRGIGTALRRAWTLPEEMPPRAPPGFEARARQSFLADAARDATTRRGWQSDGCTVAGWPEAAARQCPPRGRSRSSHRGNRRRCERTCRGHRRRALFPFTFYVASVARAHDRVFAHRGRQPAGYGISVPSQTRKRGGTAVPIFHNHVAALFFPPAPGASRQRSRKRRRP